MTLTIRPAVEADHAAVLAIVSPVLAAKQALASRLVFSKWREGVGGARRSDEAEVGVARRMQKMLACRRITR